MIGWDIFRLLWNHWTEFNETWQWARSQRRLPSLYFSGRSEKQNGRPSLWLDALSVVRSSSLTFHIFDFSWNRYTEFNETWQEARSQRHLPSLCFSGRSEKQDYSPGLWLAKTFSTSLKPLNGIQRNLTGSVFFWADQKTSWLPWPLIGRDIFDFSAERNSTKLVRKQYLNAVYQVWIFRADQKKTSWPPWHLIGWDISDFSSEAAEWNSTKLDRKQDFNVNYKVCVFRADRKNELAALASDWLRHFWLLLCWTEFNETWQWRSQRCLSTLCFRVDRKNKTAALASDWLIHLWHFGIIL